MMHTTTCRWMVVSFMFIRRVHRVIDYRPYSHDIARGYMSMSTCDALKDIKEEITVTEGERALFAAYIKEFVNEDKREEAEEKTGYYMVRALLTTDDMAHHLVGMYSIHMHDD